MPCCRAFAPPTRADGFGCCCGGFVPEVNEGAVSSDVLPTTLDITSFPPDGSVNVFEWGQVVNGVLTVTPENTGANDAINVVVTLSILIQVAPPGDDTALVTVTSVSGAGWTVNALGGNVFEITRPVAAPGVMPTITFDVTLAAPPQASIDVTTTADVVADNAPLASTSWDASIADPE